jgi:hypothetical protein
MLEKAEFDADFESVDKVGKKVSTKKLFAFKCRNYVLFHLSVLFTEVFSPRTFFM